VLVYKLQLAIARTRWAPLAHHVHFTALTCCV